MNEAFFNLPQEKQTRIINAGIEVFAKNEYKRASTEEIAYIAGISKGLLFHYFNNKKSFYIYLLEYTAALTKSQIIDQHFNEITDFFELLRHGAEKKLSLLREKSPYIMEFFIKAYYSKNETISCDIQSRMQGQLNTAFSTYLSNINWDKFKSGVDHKEIFHMLIWLVEGYMYEKERNQESVQIPELMRHYTIWADMLKQVAYKEEFL